MLNTFDALAKFPADEKNSAAENETEKNSVNASVDLSSIINRLNEMETKINQLSNQTTEIPTRGKTDETVETVTAETEKNTNEEQE